MSDSSCREDGVMPGDEMAIKGGLQSGRVLRGLINRGGKGGWKLPPNVHMGVRGLPPQYG